MFKDLNILDRVKVLRFMQSLGVTNRNEAILLYDTSTSLPDELQFYDLLLKLDGNDIIPVDLLDKKLPGGPIKQRLDFTGNWLSRHHPRRKNIFRGHGDLARYYMGLPLLDNVLYYSQYKPTKAKNPNATYIAIKDLGFINDIVDAYNDPENWTDKEKNIKNGYFPPFNGKFTNDYTLNDLGEFILTSGIDPKKGQYISYYDIWDAHLNANNYDDKTEHLGSTKPFEVYDRIYLDDYYGIDSTPQEDTYYGGWLAPVTITPNNYKKGGSIHINPKNKGKLTETMRRTGKSKYELAHSKNPLTRKRAQFAINASHWKHLDGGHLFLGDAESRLNRFNDINRFIQDPVLAQDAVLYQLPIDNNTEILLEAQPVYDTYEAALATQSDNARLLKAEDTNAFQRKVREIRNSENPMWFGAYFTPLAKPLLAANAIERFQSGKPLEGLLYAGLRFAPEIADFAGKNIDALRFNIDPFNHNQGIRQLYSWLNPIITRNIGEYSVAPYIDGSINNIKPIFNTEWQQAGWTNTNIQPILQTTVRKQPLLLNEHKYVPADIQPLIKPLMRGAEIEKQLSNNGTISRKSLDAYIKKQGKYYQEVMNSALDDLFNGIDKIDYSAFLKAVQSRLPQYTRVPQSQYRSYGYKRLGFFDEDLNGFIGEYIDSLKKFGDPTNFEDKEYGTRVLSGMNDEFDEEYHLLKNNWNNKSISREEYVDGINKMFDKFKKEALMSTKTKLSTFTFESPRIIGNTKHYQGNPIGHSRTYTTPMEPDVLHIMESQSDWALNFKLNLPNAEPKIISKPLLINENGRTNFIISGDGSGYKVVDEGTGELYDVLKKYDKDIDNRFGIEKIIIKKLEPGLLEKHMVSEYVPRQIQENLKFAAEQGQTKMRYPTRETAAKIEGYPSREAYFDAKGNDVTNSKVYTIGEDNEKELSDLRDAYKKRTFELNQQYNNGKPMGFGVDWDKYFGSLDKEYAKMADRINELTSIEPKLKPGITKRTVYDYEDILKKYSDFPKQYLKLFKNSEVRTITDSKGNTWYEVDVPKDYIQGTALILMANGGKIICDNNGQGGHLFQEAGPLNKKTDQQLIQEMENRHTKSRDSYYGPLENMYARSENNLVGLTSKAIMQLFDPTGILSYPDFTRSIKDYINGNGSFGNVVLEGLSSLPVLGIIGEPLKVTKTGKVYKASLKALSAIDTWPELIGDTKITPIIQQITSIPAERLIPFNSTARSIYNATAKGLNYGAEIPDTASDYYNYITGNGYSNGGQIIWDNNGQWSHPGSVTGITGTNNGTDITMKGVADYLYGIDNLGNVNILEPGKNYHFPGSRVVEYPMTHRRQLGGYAPNIKYTYFDDMPELPNYSTLASRQALRAGINRNTGSYNKVSAIQTAAPYIQDMYERHPANAALLPKFMDRFILDTYNLTNTLPVNITKPSLKSLQEIVDFLWAMENKNHVGINNDGTYSRYNDPNGRDYDVGPGLVIGSAIGNKPFYTKLELDLAAYDYYIDSMNKLLPLYDNKYGTGEFEKLDDSNKMVIFDVMYRVGQNGVNPTTWPGLFDAAYNNDVERLLQESRSTFKHKGTKNYDNARVERVGLYLYPEMFEYLYKNSLDPGLKVVKKQYGGVLKPFSYLPIPIVRF